MNAIIEQIEESTCASNAITLLLNQIEHDEYFHELLVESLQKAKATAQKELDSNLFNALIWPKNLTEYKLYLLEYSKWIPQQSGDDVWKIPGSNGHQEIFDRLNHFYWLIDQEVGENKNTIVSTISWFSHWLVEFAKCSGDFLDTTDSFNEKTLNSFIKYAPLYCVEDSMINGKSNHPSGWLTFNQFFARTLNPGLRPIASPMDNKIVTSPADCTYRAKYAIDANSKIPEIRIKNTHKFASIEHLLEGSKYKKDFANGTFVHYFLSPHSYHRFHAPVSGKVEECFAIQGLVHLDVNIKNNQFDAPDNSQGGYQFEQARGVIIIDTKNSPYGDVGIVAVIPIGMAQVSSVNMIATVGNNLLKGDEFGYFLFGGSDIIVLFQADECQKIDTNNNYRHYGTKIAACSSVV